MIWLYIIKVISDELEVFKIFKQMTEKKSEKSIKVLRTDGEGEHTSNEFVRFCESNGIQHSSAQWIVKRRNSTILNMAKSMIKEKKLPLSMRLANF